MVITLALSFFKVMINVDDGPEKRNVNMSELNSFKIVKGGHELNKVPTNGHDEESNNECEAGLPLVRRLTP